MLIAVFCSVYLDLVLTKSPDNVWAETAPLMVLIICVTLALMFSGSVVSSVRIRTHQLRILIQALAKQRGEEGSGAKSELEKALEGIGLAAEAEEPAPTTGTIDLPTDPFQES